jgi:hypothetical protein
MVDRQDRMTGSQNSVDARPADTERLGNLGGAKALRLHLAHLRGIY